MIRVLIERRVKAGRDAEFWEMTSKLRISAVPRQGYVTGETWVDDADPTHCIVISTWLGLE